MKCKKCGGEIAEDMPKCLWCDAVNEDYQKPETPETIDLSTALDVQEHVDNFILTQLYKGEEPPDEAQENNISKHPAGKFMWCAAILGVSNLSALLIPFYVAFFHREELKKSGKIGRFIGAYFLTIFMFNSLIKSLSEMILQLPLTAEYLKWLERLIDLAQSTLFLTLCGYTTAFIVKHLTPNYDPAEYKLTSKSATLYAVPIMIISMIVSPIIFQTNS